MVNRMEKKLLSIITVISFFGAGMFLPMTAYGETAAELQVQINALLAQIQALQAQLTAGTSTSGSASASLTSSGDLTLGSKGAAVKELQMYLNANGAQVSASGAGSPGNETEYFGGLTKSALAKWQAANGVSPAAGYFGPKTRAKMASMGETTPAPAPTMGGTTPAPIQEEIVSAPSDATVTVSLPAVPTPLPKLIVNDLKFNVDFPFLRNKNYSLFNLFDFIVESKENIAITRLRFKQTGTLDDGLIDNFRLVQVIGENETLLATFTGNPMNKFIEFNLVPNENKPNKGLVVSGGHYRVLTTITVSYGAIKPTVSLSIEKPADISVFDFNDLGRAADIPASIFPIGGPIYTISI